MEIVSFCNRPSKKLKACSPIKTQPNTEHEEYDRRIRTLIQQLTTTGNPFSDEQLCADLFGQIVVTLPLIGQNIAVQKEDMKRLFSLSIIYMGFLVPSLSDDEVLVKPRLNLLSDMTVILKMTCDKLMPGMSLGDIHPEESKEVFSLLLDIISALNQQTALLPEALSTPLNRLRLECWDFLNFVIDKNLMHGEIMERSSALIEQLLLIVLDHGDNITFGDKGDQCNLRKLLQKLRCPPFGPRIKSSSEKLILLLDDTNVTPSGICLFEKEDKFFLLKCLVQSCKVTQTNSSGFSNCEFFQNLQSKIQSDSQLYRVMKSSTTPVDCIHSLARGLQSTEDYTLVLEALVGMILCNDSGDNKNINPALTCLQLLFRTNIWVDLFLKLETSKVLFDFLAHKYACNGTEFLSKAAAVLVALISARVKKESHHRGLSMDECIRFIPVLLSVRIESVVDEAVQLVRVLFQDAKMRQEFIQTNRMVLSALAEVANDEYSSKISRQNVIQIFWDLIKDNPKEMRYLAREPKVVESLVCIASFQDINDYDKSSKLAIKILLELSKNACNRRLLAKQPGLLSIMIQYTRRNPNSKIRDDIKKQILLLASTL